MTDKKPRIAVVLFNLGGPDTPDAVKPFLFNLFNDPAIISVPHPLRWLLAKLISKKRAPIAREIYEHMGGGSPLLPLTEAQAEALKAQLSDEWDVEVFVSMRYWHPMGWQTASAVRAFAPDHVIALPLYPQYSTTTTASSFKDWKQSAKRVGLKAPTTYVCCYPTDGDFIAAHAELIRPVYEAAKAYGHPRILFSAHGLPEKVVNGGDPYQWQVEQTTEKVVEILEGGQQADPVLSDSAHVSASRCATGQANIDYVNSYQSRVGPLQWIKPATDDEIIRAGKDNVPLVVVPIAFVSEHSETLVELDIEYGKLAKEHGVPHYARVPALGENAQFISSLASICKSNYPYEGTKPAEAPRRYCGSDWKKCPCIA